MRLTWKILSGNIYKSDGGKLYSGPHSNGEFYYWFVLEVFEWEEAVGEREASEIDRTHNVSLSVVAPSECPTKYLERSLSSWGIEEKDTIDNPLALVDLLYDYGIHAVIWDRNGSLRDLLMEAKRQAETTEAFTFGFAMDRPQNGLGATGWDLIRANHFG